ncbi:MAG TPA: hypothetical protein VGC32_15105 [Solirubrobacterales bacterium]
MHKRSIFMLAVLATFLTVGACALAATEPAKKFPTKTTVATGEYTTGEGAAPIVEGKIISGKAACRKGRQVMGQFTPSNGESVITLQGAASAADGSWSTKLPAIDWGKSGTLEIVVAPKAASPTVTCRKAFAKESLSL